MVKIKELSRARLSKELLLKLFNCGAARLDSSWHGVVSCSPVSRLYFVKRGSFYLILKGKRVELTEGGWYLIPCSSSYEYGCEGDTEQLFFHLNLMGDDRIDVFEKQSCPLALKEDQGTAAEIEEQLCGEDCISALGIKNNVMRILLRMIKEHSIDVSGTGYSACVIKAMDHIDKNLSETLTIKGISEAIFVSESTLTKHFRRELNTSVNRYVDELILTRAAQMLAEGQCSLNTVSNRFGFCDQFYFSRKFKARFGVSPSEYKRTLNI